MRIVFVTWGLPPQLNGSAVIMANLALQFSPEEVVLASERPSGPRPPRSNTLPHRLHYIMNEWSWPRRGQRFIHWIRWFWLPVVICRLVLIIRREKCNAVLGVFPNEFYLSAAYFAALISKTRFFAYFHNTYLENRSGWKRLFARWLQPRVFSKARTVFVMSEGMCTYLAPKYPKIEFVPLVHSFNESIDAISPPGMLHQPARLAFVGNLNASNVDAMRRFAEIINRRKDCVVTVFSSTPVWFFERVGVCGPAFRYTQAPYDQITSAIREQDILLLPHGFEGGLAEAEYLTIFPTRTLTYLLGGRPILAHTPPHAFLTHWLRRNMCAEIVDKASSKDLEAALDRLLTDASYRIELVKAGFEALSQFSAPSVAALLRKHIS
jgi:hypothetical protein